jgi:hypothetical protein
MSTAKFSGTPMILSLKKGVYSCNCVPPLKFAADGKPHALTGDPYADTGMAKIVSPTEVDLTMMKAGKPVLTQALTASADGNSIEFKGSDSSATNSAPVDFDYTAKREGTAPAGAHAISGKWMATQGSASDNGLVTTLKVDGDTLTMSTPTGQSYTAKFGGPEVPYKGDPGTTTVAVKKIGKSGFQETDFRDGKASYVTVMKVAADGKSASMVTQDKLHGRKIEVTALKQ